MLDFVYYPVSAVLWAWHWHNVLTAALGTSCALSWVLAVVCLVATLRAVLVVPFLKQVRFQQVMLRRSRRSRLYRSAIRATVAASPPRFKNSSKNTV
jgi:hypothetical protein